MSFSVIPSLPCPAYLCCSQLLSHLRPARLLPAQPADELVCALQLHAAQLYVGLQLLLLARVGLELCLHGGQLVQQALSRDKHNTESEQNKKGTT